MSLRSVIMRHQTGTYTVTRTAEGTHVKGVAQAGAVSTLSVVAYVEPVSGMDLQTLPEAYHADDVRIVYTTTFLGTIRPGFRPDQIVIDNEVYEVFRSQTWQGLSGAPHYRVWVSRIPLP